MNANGQLLLDSLSLGHSSSVDNDNNPMAGDNGNTSCHLVYTSSKSKIYRFRHDRGIKVASAITQLEDSKQQEYMHDIMKHEQRISEHLPPSVPKRRVIKLENFQGCHAFHFEWVTGLTLEEWLRNHNNHEMVPQNQSNQAQLETTKQKLRVAVAITKTLKEYHDAGVAHKKISLSNIILEETTTATTYSCLATLIDLSRSVILGKINTDKNSHSADYDAKRLDLESLGYVFQQLFEVGSSSGEEDDRECCGGPKMNSGGRNVKRGKSSSQHQRAIEGLPLYLSSLISALFVNRNLNYGTVETYANVNAVLSDLRIALDKYETYFRPAFDRGSSSQNTLPILDAFYGRQSEMTVLTNSFHSVMNLGQPSITVISGHAGMGKTKLIDQIQKHVEIEEDLHDKQQHSFRRRRGYMIRGKFESTNNGSRSDWVLFQALDSFFGRFVEDTSSGDEIDSKAQMLRDKIEHTVGFGLGDLIQSIPNLGKLVGNVHKPRDLSTASQQQLLHRWKFLLCKLVGCISNIYPIVFVFDDLQWADEAMRNVIQTIVTDPDVTYCLYLVAFRDNDAMSKGTVTNMLDTVRSQGVKMFTINLTPFEIESTNALISESMSLPPSLSQPLASLVHRKTAGSPNYVVNFLWSLNREGIIRFNLATRRWEYRIEAIRRKEVPKEIVEYMMMQMTSLPPSYRLVLKLASCLGHSFDHSTFIKARIKQGVDLEAILPFVCEVGYIQEVSPNKFIWAHDQIQQAAYNLIPESLKESFHILIGSHLLLNTPENEMNTSVFSIVGQMNKGIRLIQTTSQQYEVARLNFFAGDLALRTSSFDSASNYFLNGIKLLPDECWGHEYDMAMKLHEAAQEALFVMGDFSMLSNLCEVVFTNARTFLDKLNSYHNLVRYLVSSGQMEKAISTCMSVLDELGETVGEITNFSFMREFAIVRELLQNRTDTEILGLPSMTDQSKLATMEFLQHMISSANHTNPQLLAIVVFRVVKMTLEHGLCDASSVCFACYGTFLMSNVASEDLEGSYRYSKLAIKLLDQLGAHRFSARVILVVYGYNNIYKEPLQGNMDKLLDGYNAACVNGDMEYAYWNIQAFSWIALYSGQDLGKLQHDLRTYAKRAIQCKQVMVAYAIVPCLSIALEFTGDASKEDIYNTFFNATEDALLQQLQCKHAYAACVLMWSSKKYCCIFKGDMAGAVQMYRNGSKVSSGKAQRIRSMAHLTNVFADGLIALYMAREHGRDEHQWILIAEGMIETMKKWTCSGSKWNFENKLYLLEAEYFFLMGDDKSALEKYCASIAAAKSHRFIHEEALANFHLANYHIYKGRNSDALAKFSQARNCYEQWGAWNFVNRMKDAIISSSCEQSPDLPM
ncbi:hypothetical protein ACHAXR_008840 [Thalassiosira sp. AJA248-18]